MGRMVAPETWATRVAEWRASGQTSTDYAEGKGFSAGGLRSWAHRLESGGERQAPALVRMARVVRVSELKSSPVERKPVEAAEELVVEVGPVRVLVRRGFDRATLGAVLDVLTARSGR